MADQLCGRLQSGKGGCDSPSWLAYSKSAFRLTTAAIKRFTAYAFKKYGLKRIYAYTRVFNKGSRLALEKAGYKLEGILRKDVLKNGKYLDECIYAYVR